jgi:hypothetical protein
MVMVKLVCVFVVVVRLRPTDRRREEAAFSREKYR